MPDIDDEALVGAQSTSEEVSDCFLDHSGATVDVNKWGGKRAHGPAEHVQVLEKSD